MPVTNVHLVTDGRKFAGEQTLTAVTCPSCGILHALPQSLDLSARKYPGPPSRAGSWTLHCPMGHSWWYTGQSHEEKLEHARRDAARAVAERDQARADATAQKAAKTRFKNQRDRERTRVAGGVCPCCNRTFQNLARHMAGQHPEHAVPDSVEEATTP